MDYSGLAEKLREVHTFPCCYTIKIVGVSELLQEATIRDAVDLALPGVGLTLTSRASSAARYTAWTLDVEVPDVESVITLYHGLQALPGLKALL
jgi:putative lipoic acid-binding regulatory protein